MAEPFGDNQGHSDGRGAGSNRDYLVGATMIGSSVGRTVRKPGTQSRADDPKPLCRLQASQ